MSLQELCMNRIIQGISRSKTRKSFQLTDFIHKTPVGLHTKMIEKMINLIEKELKKLGVEVASTQNSMTIFPQNNLNNNVAIETYNDHRIAMCFSLFCLKNLNIIIKDPECVNKTYPNYFKDLESIIE